MATNTYVALATQTIANNTTAYVEFTSIPQTYTDLVVVSEITSYGGGGNYIYAQWGDSTIDTGANYSTTVITSYGSGQASNRWSGRTNYNMDYFATPVTTEPSNRILNIMNYAGSKYKTILSRANRAGGGVDATVGSWRSASAINVLRITTDTNFFASGSTFTLYGVTRATALSTTAKATGGTITYASDGYTYHTFTSSGTFTPSQNLTNVDYLVVAGGGGGSNTGAGGGAGGLRSTMYQTGGGAALESQLSLTSGTGYTVTVGAGGSGDTTSAGSNSVFGSITSLGGGCGGGNQVGRYNGVSGGSGGGARSDLSGTAGSGTTGQGYAGSKAAYGGGGGAGGPGEATGSDANGSRGGIGAYLPTVARATSTGDNGYYAGGGSSLGSKIYPAGGLGGGGRGALYPNQGDNGTANTGGGGGASSNSPFQSGGSGIVIIRYAN